MAAEIITAKRIDLARLRVVTGDATIAVTSVGGRRVVTSAALTSDQLAQAIAAHVEPSDPASTPSSTDRRTVAENLIDNATAADGVAVDVAGATVSGIVLPGEPLTIRWGALVFGDTGATVQTKLYLIEDGQVIDEQFFKGNAANDLGTLQRSRTYRRPAGQHVYKVQVHRWNNGGNAASKSHALGQATAPVFLEVDGLAAAGYFSSYSTGRVTAAEGDLILLPRNWAADATRRAVVYLHGAGELARSILSPAGNKTLEARLIAGLVAAGYPLLACDLGTGVAGPTQSDNWGSTAGEARALAAVNYALANLGAKADKVLLLSVSMGNATMVNLAKNNPAKVAAMAGIIPVSDLQDVRDNNRGGLRGSVDSAHGVVYPAALPAGRNPATSNAGAVGIPYRAWYSEADTVISPPTVRALATAVGGTAVKVSDVLDHSDAAVGAVPLEDLLAFYAPVS